MAGEEPEAYADVVHRVLLPTIETELLAIGKLRRPAGERQQIEMLLHKEYHELENLAVMRHVPSIRQARQNFVESTRMFRAYGLEACVNGPAGG